MHQVINSPLTLGQFLNRVRKSKKLTQHETGQTFKLDQTTISSIEQGAKGTRIDTIFRLLAALDLEMIIQEKGNQQKRIDW